ncbi:hypothetical protein EOL03_26065, partial [Escherichia coli]
PPISLFSPLFWVGFTPQLVRFNKLQSPLAGVVPATVSRMAQGATPGTVDVGGDVGTKFRWGQHDDFL